MQASSSSKPSTLPNDCESNIDFNQLLADDSSVLTTDTSSWITVPHKRIVQVTQAWSLLVVGQQLAVLSISPKNDFINAVELSNLISIIVPMWAIRLVEEDYSIQNSHLHHLLPTQQSVSSTTTQLPSTVASGSGSSSTVLMPSSLPSPVPSADSGSTSSHQTDSESGPTKKERKRNPAWDKKYDAERKKKGKRGHGVNLLWDQRERCSSPYPDFFDKRIDLLLNYRPQQDAGGSLDNASAGYASFTHAAIQNAKTSIKQYKNSKSWRVWLPDDVWGRFSLLKSLCAPQGTTSIEFAQMLIELGEFTNDGLVDIVGFVEFQNTPEAANLVAGLKTPDIPQSVPPIPPLSTVFGDARRPSIPSPSPSSVSGKSVNKNITDLPNNILDDPSTEKLSDWMNMVGSSNDLSLWVDEQMFSATPSLTMVPQPNAMVPVTTGGPYPNMTLAPASTLSPATSSVYNNSTPSPVQMPTTLYPNTSPMTSQASIGGNFTPSPNMLTTNTFNVGNSPQQMYSPTHSVPSPQNAYFDPLSPPKTDNLVLTMKGVTHYTTATDLSHALECIPKANGGFDESLVSGVQSVLDAVMRGNAGVGQPLTQFNVVTNSSEITSNAIMQMKVEPTDSYKAKKDSDKSEDPGYVKIVTGEYQGKDTKGKGKDEKKEGLVQPDRPLDADIGFKMKETESRIEKLTSDIDTLSAIINETRTSSRDPAEVKDELKRKTATRTELKRLMQFMSEIRDANKKLEEREAEVLQAMPKVNNSNNIARKISRRQTEVEQLSAALNMVAKPTSTSKREQNSSSSGSGSVPTTAPKARKDKNVEDKGWDDIVAQMKNLKENMIFQANEEKKRTSTTGGSATDISKIDEKIAAERARDAREAKVQEANPNRSSRAKRTETLPPYQAPETGKSSSSSQENIASVATLFGRMSISRKAPSSKDGPRIPARSTSLDGKSKKSKTNAFAAAQRPFKEWWASGQDLKTLRTLFKSHSNALPILLSVYMDSNPNDYHAEMMAETISVLSQNDTINPSQVWGCVLGLVETKESDIPASLSNLLRVLVVKGIVSLKDVVGLIGDTEDDGDENDEEEEFYSDDEEEEGSEEEDSSVSREFEKKFGSSVGGGASAGAASSTSKEAPFLTIQWGQCEWSW